MGRSTYSKRKDVITVAGTSTTSTPRTITPTSTHAFTPTSTPRTTTRVKTYLDPDNTAKRLVNKHYAVRTRKYLGTSARNVILDTGACITSQQLVDEGFACDQIFAPNINMGDCKALTEYGVISPHMTIEEFLRNYTVGANALWYDSMTNICGSVARQHYIGVVADLFLRQNRLYIGHACVLAVTMSTHNNMPDSIHGSSVKTLMTQVKRLAALRGFVIRYKYQVLYKKNMIYAMWHLLYDPMSAGRVRNLLVWKRSRTPRYCGFPAGYVL
jgi:hypothetical protein